MIAALYIDPRGPYRDMDGVAAYDGVNVWIDGHAHTNETRTHGDARNYGGPWPNIAHPPYGPYCKIRRQYQGSEHECAPWAVAQVRRFGGVLEQPAESALWRVCSLPPIGGLLEDHFGGYSVAMEQVEWGHVARKRTWLYLVDVPREALEKPPYPGRAPTHWCSGSRTCATGGSVPPGLKVCSAQQRRRTPHLFAEYLVRLARAAGEARAGKRITA